MLVSDIIEYIDLEKRKQAFVEFESVEKAILFRETNLELFRKEGVDMQFSKLDKVYHGKLLNRRREASEPHRVLLMSFESPVEDLTLDKILQLILPLAAPQRIVLFYRGEDTQVLIEFETLDEAKSIVENFHSKIVESIAENPLVVEYSSEVKSIVIDRESATKIDFTLTQQERFSKEAQTALAEMECSAGIGKKKRRRTRKSRVEAAATLASIYTVTGGAAGISPEAANAIISGTAKNALIAAAVAAANSNGIAASNTTCSSHNTSNLPHTSGICLPGTILSGRHTLSSFEGNNNNFSNNNNNTTHNHNISQVSSSQRYQIQQQNSFPHHSSFNLTAPSATTPTTSATSVICPPPFQHSNNFNNNSNNNNNSNTNGNRSSFQFQPPPPPPPISFQHQMDFNDYHPIRFSHPSQFNQGQQPPGFPHQRFTASISSNAAGSLGFESPSAQTQPSDPRLSLETFLQGALPPGPSTSSLNKSFATAANQIPFTSNQNTLSQDELVSKTNTFNCHQHQMNNNNNNHHATNNNAPSTLLRYSTNQSHSTSNNHNPIPLNNNSGLILGSLLTPPPRYSSPPPPALGVVASSSSNVSSFVSGARDSGNTAFAPCSNSFMGSFIISNSNNNNNNINNSTSPFGPGRSPVVSPSHQVMSSTNNNPVIGSVQNLPLHSSGSHATINNNSNNNNNNNNNNSNLPSYLSSSTTATTSSALPLPSSKPHLFNQQQLQHFQHQSGNNNIGTTSQSSLFISNNHNIQSNNINNNNNNTSLSFGGSTSSVPPALSSPIFAMMTSNNSSFTSPTIANYPSSIYNNDQSAILAPGHSYNPVQFSDIPSHIMKSVSNSNLITQSGNFIHDNSTLFANGKYSENHLVDFNYSTNPSGNNSNNASSLHGGAAGLKNSMIDSKTQISAREAVHSSNKQANFGPPSFY